MNSSLLNYLKRITIITATIGFVLVFTKCNLKQPSVIQPPLVPASKAWLGKWERSSLQEGAFLQIKKISNDSIQFTLDALNGGHTGQVEGWAVVKDSIAIYFEKTGNDSCYLKFKREGDSVITIEQNDCAYTAGVAVYYDGRYKNEKLLPKDKPEETMLSLGILKTQEQDSIFKSLVDSKYTEFVNSTQLTSEDDDIDSLQTKVFTSGVRGLFTFMENIVMIDSSNNIWAAVIDDKKVYYFTNNRDYKEVLPKTIEKWRENFSEYEVIYNQ